jgi:hypothetical protein
VKVHFIRIGPSKPRPVIVIGFRFHRIRSFAVILIINVETDRMRWLARSRPSVPELFVAAHGVTEIPPRTWGHSITPLR